MFRYTLLLLISSLSFNAAFAQGGAIITPNEKVHDFGKVLIDSPLHCTFEFTNTGTGVLVITGIEPSCHCVTATWTRGAISPGEKGKIDVTVTPPHDIRFYRTLMISSNASNVDPSLMRFELDVKGEGVKEMPKVKKITSRTKTRTHKR